MKYIILVGDGMSDYPIAELGERTPLEAARTPNMDYIAQYGRLGRVKTIPDKLSPASDVANMSILGYDPQQYYTGRGPLEAANLGIDLQEGDVAFRCNLVTVSGGLLVDYSAGHISQKEAEGLIKFIDDNLGSDKIRFSPGISYRHLMLFKNASDLALDKLKCRPPHDIIGQPFKNNLPKGKNAQVLINLMEGSRKILDKHEINLVRLDLKENPANMIWLWGAGKKPVMPSFKERFGLGGSIISAVDLLKGLGKILGLEVINVPGATGYYDTNYEGKAKAAIKSLKDKDFVFVHVEAPDEAGHNGDLREKIASIERFDQLVVGTILNAFRDKKDVRVLVLPDHATPISLRTHSSDAVPFAVFGEGIPAEGPRRYCEREAQKTALYLEKGHTLMEYFIKK